MLRAKIIKSDYTSDFEHSINRWLKQNKNIKIVEIISLKELKILIIYKKEEDR